MRESKSSEDSKKSIVETEQPWKKTKTAFDGIGRRLVAPSEDEMIRKVYEGYSLLQSLNNDRYLRNSVVKMTLVDACVYKQPRV